MELLNSKIKRKINSNHIEDNIKAIIVTSSDYNTQTNKVILELIKRLTRKNKTVLLINADIEKEINKIKYENMIKKEKLYIVDYQEIINRKDSILGTTSMEEFIRKSEENYDYVILNAPGIGVNNDIMVLSNFVDKTILVQGNNMDNIRSANSKLKMIRADVLRIK